MTKKYQQLSLNPILSCVILLGFLCLQFHALSHLDVGFQASQHTTQQSHYNLQGDSPLSIIVNEIPVECPSCVLAEQLFVDDSLSPSSITNASSQSLSLAYTDKSNQQSVTSYQLRAPPSFGI